MNKLVLRLIAVLVISGIASPAFADYSFKRHDCRTDQGAVGFVMNYVESNAGNVAKLAKSLVPVLGVTKDPALQVNIGDVPVLGDVGRVAEGVVPDAKAMLSSEFVGTALSVLKVFLQVGGSPLAAFNIPLGFVCVEFSKDEPKPEPAKSAVIVTPPTPLPESAGERG